MYKSSLAQEDLINYGNINYQSIKVETEGHSQKRTVDTKMLRGYKSSPGARSNIKHSPALKPREPN